MSRACVLPPWSVLPLCLTACFCCLPGLALAGNSNSLMDISRDGKLLACSNRDSGSVTIVDLASHRKRYEIAVGRHPEGVSFIGPTHRVAVAVYADDKIVYLDADSGTREEGETEVFDEPYSVVSDRTGERLFVTLDYPGEIVEVDVASKNVTQSHKVGAFTRALALSHDEKRLLTCEYYTGRVLAIDAVTGKQLDEWPGASNDNLARQIVLHPTRDKAYVPHIRSRVTAVHGEGSIFPYVSIIDTLSDEERRRRRVPMDAFVGNRVTANPWEVAIAPDGERAYVVFAGTDDMFACNVLDDNYREITYKASAALGKNPRAVRVSPDSRMVYVYQALDFNVLALDAANLRTVAVIDVTDNPLGEEVLRGKVLFYSAKQPMVGRRWITCSSCHPDGDPDGRTWHNPEGLRNTQALFGLAWTHPVHWSADRDEVQDFENTIRSKLMQGKGLIEGKVNPDLGPPNKGLSADLDAVAAYTNSHRHTLSPHAKGGLSEAAKRGQTLFHAKETRCAECHGGPFYTDSQPREKHLMHDVGTGEDDPSEKLGPAYDTPSLLGVYRTAPYLHHGKAATLAEVLTVYNRGDRHGKTSHLTPEQIDDLVEFMKALPFEDPEPAAEKAGLTKVEK